MLNDSVGDHKMLRRLFVTLILLSMFARVSAQDDPAESCPDTLPTRLSDGNYARVTPDGDANRVRSEPTTSGAALGRIPSSGTFWIGDGPVCADGYTWWYAEYRGLNGWTAEGTAEEYWLEPVSDEDAPILNVDGLSEVIVFGSNDVDGHGAVFVSDLNGNVSVNLTPPDKDDYNPIVSPDFTQIAVNSMDIDGVYHLILMGFDGSFRRELGENITFTDLTWSPESNRLTFLAQNSDPTSEHHNIIGTLNLMSINGGEPRVMTNNFNDHGQAAWSPDGTQIAYSERFEDSHSTLWLMDVASGETRQIHVMVGANLGAHSWSPDGSTLAVRAVINNAPKPFQFFLMNLEGTNLRQPTGEGLDTQEFAWSPDGSRIAFVSERTGYSEIYVVNVDGSGLTQITHDEACAVNPSWSADGQHILFISNRDREQQNLCVGDVYMMDTDGNNVRRLTDNERDNHAPYWIEIAPPLPPD
jgi:Tol biopolymer transport system component